MSQAILKKIAEAAGVSLVTAYRALNHHPYVRKELQERIYQAASSLGYIPPRAARRCQVALISRAIDDGRIGFYSNEVIGTLVSACGRRGISVEMVFSDNLDLLEEHFLRAGVVFQSSLDSKLLASHRNTSFYSLNSLHHSYPGVATDDVQAVTLGLMHLHDRGCRRIAVAVIPAIWDPVIKKRLAAYESFCRKMQRDYRNIIMVDASAQNQSWLQTLKKEKTDALFVLGEDLLLLVYHGLMSGGIEIPEQISLLGFENQAAAYLEPAVSTIAQDFGTMVEYTLDWVEGTLDGKKENKKSRQLIPARLIERKSVR